MSQISRIAFILKILRVKQLATEELKSLLEAENEKVSLHQIQRELKLLDPFLNKNEYLTYVKLEKTNYYSIHNKHFKNTLKNIPILEYTTQFYKQTITEPIEKSIKSIEKAIKTKRAILIKKIINDETGDNSDFETKNFEFHPVHILLHHNTYYLGGWNPKIKITQIFGINQIENFDLTPLTYDYKIAKAFFDQELQKRFGVTKNINNEVYVIKIEMSPVLAGFIKNHSWHPSQKFSKKNNNYSMHIKCGINRELMGWLFQWMYNIKIIQPPILIDYYQKTLEEMQKNSLSKKRLMYRNIFETK